MTWPVALTGASGFLGWHIRSGFKAAGVDSIAIPRHFDELIDSETIIHAAGVNRGTDKEVETGNVLAAQKLVAWLGTGTKKLVYLNTTRSTDDSPYGRGKTRAAEILQGACQQKNIQLFDLKLPNIFGESGRPFYNSFVATFCHQIASGGTPQILEDNPVNLLHASEVADVCVEIVRSGSARQFCPKNLTVSEVASLLQNQYQVYTEGVVPNLDLPFETQMFNTLRSFMFPGHYPVDFPLRADNRGELVETVKAGSGGQCFVSWTNPGITRGNHFHRRKFERFLVLEGEAEITLRRLFSNDVQAFRVSGKKPQVVDMPTLHTHAISNVGNSRLLTMFWTNEIFDPNDTDTHSEPVQV